jgi:hypothetical protein
VLEGEDLASEQGSLLLARGAGADDVGDQLLVRELRQLGVIQLTKVRGSVLP